MRLSGLSLAAVLLLSSVVLAQHHDTPSAPPPPSPPPAAPSPAPSFTPSPAPSFTPSAPSSPPASHVSPPSAPSPPPAAPSHISEPSSSSHEPTAPAPHVPPDADRVVPEHKITGEQKIESAPRVGEELRPREPIEKNSPDKEKEANATPDLRRHICGDKPCAPPEPKPVEPEKDLRHRVPCLKEPCPCPPGQVGSKGDCNATVVQNTACPAGQIWNGGTCIQRTCPPNQVWNGIQCVPSSDECVATLGPALHLIDQLRALKAQMEEACTQAPGGQECLDLTQQHAILLEEYRALFNRTSMACRNRLPDPDTL